MNWLTQHAKTLAVTTIAVGGLIIATQTTARAVASAFVQITNSTSAPGVVQDLSHAASQMIELTGTIDGFENAAALQSLRQLNPATGQMNPNPFVVPQGQSLVVTEVDLTSITTSTQIRTIGLTENLTSVADISMFREVWDTPGSEITSQLKFNPGIVFASGHTIQAFVGSGTSTPADVVRVWGYLTSN